MSAGVHVILVLPRLKRLNPTPKPHSLGEHGSSYFSKNIFNSFESKYGSRWGWGVGKTSTVFSAENPVENLCCDLHYSGFHPRNFSSPLTEWQNMMHFSRMNDSAEIRFNNVLNDSTTNHLSLHRSAVQFRRMNSWNPVLPSIMHLQRSP